MPIGSRERWIEAIHVEVEREEHPDLIRRGLRQFGGCGLVTTLSRCDTTCEPRADDYRIDVFRSTRTKFVREHRATRNDNTEQLSAFLDEYERIVALSGDDFLTFVLRHPCFEVDSIPGLISEASAAWTFRVGDVVRYSRAVGNGKLLQLIVESPSIITDGRSFTSCTNGEVIESDELELVSRRSPSGVDARSVAWLLARHVSAPGITTYESVLRDSPDDDDNTDSVSDSGSGGEPSAADAQPIPRCDARRIGTPDTISAQEFELLSDDARLAAIVEAFSHTRRVVDRARSLRARKVWTDVQAYIPAVAARTGVILDGWMTALVVGADREATPSSEVRSPMDDLLQTVPISNRHASSLNDAAQRMSVLVAELRCVERFLLEHEALPEHVEGADVLLGITALDLSRKGLTSLPSELRCLVRLRKLDLSDNPLGAVPPVLADLNGLRWCSLANTGITQLLSGGIDADSAYFDFEQQLEWLDLSRNPLQRFVLSGLSSLRGLSLRSCGLKILPESIGLLQKLETLDVSDNQIVQLPRSAEYVRKLHIVGLPEELQATQNGTSALEYDWMSQRFSPSRRVRVQFEIGDSWQYDSFEGEEWRSVSVDSIAELIASNEESLESVDDAQALYTDTFEIEPFAVTLAADGMVDCYDSQELETFLRASSTIVQHDFRRLLARKLAAQRRSWTPEAECLRSSTKFLVRREFTARHRSAPPNVAWIAEPFLLSKLFMTTGDGPVYDEAFLDVNSDIEKDHSAATLFFSNGRTIRPTSISAMRAMMACAGKQHDDVSEAARWLAECFGVKRRGR